jgi:IS1 family transposase
MNQLSIERKALVIKTLCEGNSIRSTSRITNTAINTVIKVLRETGNACMEYQDKVFHNLSCQTLQVDEIWSFCYSKQNNIPIEHHGEFGYGDVWTFTAIDADTKLVPCWCVGARDPETAYDFMHDLSKRLANKVQLTTDGHKMYFTAVRDNFREIDYAMLVKLYGKEETGINARYSPSICLSATPKAMIGNPNLEKASTSFVERQNLTMRMSMRRFTRLTNGFSKKIENHMLAIALYFMHYNFVRSHKTLSNPYPKTPAMAAGLSDHMWTFEEIIKLAI